MLGKVLTLLGGGLAAQLAPLVLGPLLSRQYGPELFGQFNLAFAVAANIAVVACARYEFALPLTQDEGEAEQLRQLCGLALAAVGGLTLVATGILAASLTESWPLSIALFVAALAGLSLWTLEANRRQSFVPLAWSRVVQSWGGSLAQALAGWFHAGLWGLLAGPIMAAAAAAILLKRACSVRQGLEPFEVSSSAVRWLSPASRERLAQTAYRWREFPLVNGPQAFASALQDTLSIVIIATLAGPLAAGVWGLVLRYLKAPAMLVGSAVSQALYPRLSQDGAGPPTLEGRATVRRTLAVLLAIGCTFGLVLGVLSPVVLPALFGSGWESAGAVGQALAPYIAMHFMTSPFTVVTMAWGAQAWALRTALIGQALFAGALALGLAYGDLVTASWAVSCVMVLHLSWYAWSLARWPLRAATPPQEP